MQRPHDPPPLPRPTDPVACHGPSRYSRATDLPKLTGMWPNEIDGTTLAGHARLLSKLKRALRAERQRGLAGHWTYDLARHSQLLAAYRCEVAAFEAGFAAAKFAPGGRLSGGQSPGANK